MVNVHELLDTAERDCAAAFSKIDKIEAQNTEKVARAFINNSISYRHFAPTTGYGYDDIGRDAYSNMLSEVFGCE